MYCTQPHKAVVQYNHTKLLLLYNSLVWLYCITALCGCIVQQPCVVVLYTTTQGCYTIQPHKAVVQYNHTRLFYNTTTQGCSTIQPHKAVLQYNHTCSCIVEQPCVVVLYNNLVWLYCITALCGCIV
jgi:hypothetical protein